MGYIITAAIGMFLGHVVCYMQLRKEGDAMRKTITELRRTNERYRDHILWQVKVNGQIRGLEIDPDE
jgi:hypothetical protein